MVSFMFLDPGISTIVGREIQDELQSVRKVLTSTLIIQLTISLALLPFVVLIPLDLLTNGYNIPDVTSLLLCGAAFMFCFSSSHKAFLRTLGRSDIEAKIRVLDRLTLFLGYVFLWRTGGSVYDFSLTIFVIQVVTLSVIIYNCFSVCSKIEDSLGKSQSERNFNPVSMIKRALPFFLFMAMMQVADRTDKIFLALSVSPEDIATYGVSLLVFFAGISVTRILRGVMLPWFGAAAKNFEELNRRYSTATLFSSAIAPVGLVGSLIVFELVVPLLFPTDFIFPTGRDFTSLTIFQILIIAWSIAVLSSPFLEFVRATKSASTVNLIHFIALSIGFLCAYFTVPEFGVYGAATSMVLPQLTFIIFFFVSLIADKSTHKLEFPIFQNILSLFCSATPLIFFIPGLGKIWCWLFLISISLFSFYSSSSHLMQRISKFKSPPIES